MKKLYLACPYTHNYSDIENERCLLATKKAAELMNQGYIVFSPLTHSVPIDDFFDDFKSYDFWLAQDFPFIEWCDILYILQLPGYRKSKGVQDEIEYATKLGKEIIYSHGD